MGDQSAPRLTLDVPWFPVVRHNHSDESTGTWMGALAKPLPVIATGVDFALQVMRGHHERTLRERLGVPASTIVLVHGQIRPEALEKVSDARNELTAWLREDAKVDGLLTPQFVTDEEAPDLDRAFAWYHASVEAGFRFPILQHPGAQPRKTAGLLQECYDFAEAEEVRLVALSISTDRGRGGLLPATARDHMLAKVNYGEGIGFLHFGASTMLRMRMSAKLLGALDGEHEISFSNATASTSAAFYMRLPERVTAPSKWSKAETFRHNIEGYEALAARVLRAQERPRKARRPLRKTSRAR